MPRLLRLVAGPAVEVGGAAPPRISTTGRPLTSEYIAIRQLSEPHIYYSLLYPGA